MSSSVSSADSAKNARSAALAGIRHAKNSRVIVVRSDTCSEEESLSSSSSSCASPTGCLSKSSDADVGGGDGYGRDGTGGRGTVGRSVGDGDATSCGCSIGGCKKSRSCVPSTTSSSTKDRNNKSPPSSKVIVESSRNCSVTASGRRTGRIACIDGGGGDDDDGLPVKGGWGVRVRNTNDDWDDGRGSTPEQVIPAKSANTDDVVHARRKARASFALRLLSPQGIAVRGRQWASERWHTSAQTIVQDTSASAGHKTREGATGLRRATRRLCLDLLDNLTARLVRREKGHQLGQKSCR